MLRTGGWILALILCLIIPIFLWNQTNLSKDHSTHIGALEHCDSLWDYGRELADNGSWDWQPHNCQLADYSTKTRNISDSLRICAEKLPLATKKSAIRVLFMGDSRMRQLQASLYRALNGKPPPGPDIPFRDYCDVLPPTNFTSREKHLYEQECPFHRKVNEFNFEIERWWAPYFMPSIVALKLHRILALPYSEAPSMVIINSGMWLIRDCDQNNISFENCYQNYTRNILALKPDLMRLSEFSTVVWMLQNNVGDCLDWGRWKAGTRIYIFNDAAVRIFTGTKVKIWRSYYQIFDLFGGNGEGVHIGEAALAVLVRIILNSLCNAIMQTGPSYCCSED